MKTLAKNVALDFQHSPVLRPYFLNISYTQ